MKYVTFEELLGDFETLYQDDVGTSFVKDTNSYCVNISLSEKYLGTKDAHVYMNIQSFDEDISDVHKKCCYVIGREIQEVLYDVGDCFEDYFTEAEVLKIVNTIL